MTKENKISYLLFLADSHLILGQRNAEWCGHGPVLEQDIAITNISLDLIGQARNYYQYAASLMGEGHTEDSLAYLRTEREFKNCLLVEQPNGDWAQTTLRQFFFSTYSFFLLEQLINNEDASIAAMAEKALKEVSYHKRWSSEWVVRLGDGTEESHRRMNEALSELWRYTGEFFQPASYESGLSIDLTEIKTKWENSVREILSLATLTWPAQTFMQTGGKTGVHTEYLGYILSELQYMQRTYPHASW